MLIKSHQIKVPMILNLILVFFYITTSLVNGVEIASRKLDEATVSTTNGTDEKCTPCGDSSPPPPPPVNPPPSPPPPSPKKPPSQVYCPPPPSPSYIYITGPPGNLYPVDENFSGAIHRHRSFAVLLLPLAVAFLGMIAF